MKKLKEILYKIIMSICILTILVSSILSIINNIKNIEKTELELFIENPWYAIVCIISFLIYTFIYLKYESKTSNKK
jgi:hypothetical protein